MIEVREETPSDLPGIRYVNEQAFGGPAEARLVDMLRASSKVAVSLVAIIRIVLWDISFSRPLPFRRPRTTFERSGWHR